MQCESETEENRKSTIPLQTNQSNLGRMGSYVSNALGLLADANYQMKILELL